ncbi:hypothetical protein McPS_18260 [Marichromatium sp. PS1]
MGHSNGRQPPAASRQLPATSYQLPATSYQLPATRGLNREDTKDAKGNKLPAISHQWVRTPAACGLAPTSHIIHFARFAALRFKPGGWRRYNQVSSCDICQCVCEVPGSTLHDLSILPSIAVAGPMSGDPVWNP